jgi:hypothetical protein
MKVVIGESFFLAQVKNCHSDVLSQHSYLVHSFNGLTCRKAVHCSYLTVLSVVRVEQNRTDIEHTTLILSTLKAVPIERKLWWMI